MKKIILSIIFFALLISFVACDDEKPNQPPTLAVSADPTSGAAPLAVQFTANGEDPEGKPLTYSWNFGDGSAASAEQNPAHTYSVAGEYTAACTVADSGSPSLTAAATIGVEVLAQNPVLSSLTPPACVMHVPSFTLTVTGSNFHSDAAIVFNGAEKSTTYINSKKLTCILSPEDTVISSLASPVGGYIPDTSSTVEVKVVNPGSGGGESNAVDFTIHTNYSFEDAAAIAVNAGGECPAVIIDNSGRLHLFYGGSLTHIRSSDGGASWSSGINVSAAYNPFVSNHDFWAGVDSYDILYVAFTGDPSCSCESKSWDIWLASLLSQSNSWETKNLTADWALEPGSTLPFLIIQNDDPIVAFGVAMDYGGYQHTIAAPPWTGLIVPPNMAHGEKELDHSLAIDPAGTLHYTVITSTYSTLHSINIVHFSSFNHFSSYSATHLISSTYGYATAVNIISDANGILYAFWADGTTSGARKLYYSYSEDAGETWYRQKALSGTGGYKYITAKIDSAGNIILVFSKTDYGVEKIYFFRSIDGGANWSQSKKINEMDATSGPQAFAIDRAGRMHVTWQDGGGNVYYARSSAY